MGKIRVLHVIGSANRGGGETILCRLLENMDKEKFEFFIACPPKGNMIKAYENCAQEVKTISVDRLWHLWAPFQLFSYIKEKEISIVHTHLYPSDTFGVIAAKISRVPVVIATIHGRNFGYFGQISLRNIKNFIFSLFYRIIYRFDDAVIAVCYAIKNDLVTRRGIKVRQEKIKVIYNGIDLNAAKDEVRGTGGEPFAGLDGRTLVGMIANFDLSKGHRILIKALPKVVREFPQIKVLLVGDGEERKFIEQAATDLGLSDYLIFTGTRDDTAKIISLCKFIILPTLVEGFSLVVMEAMASGKPVIATAVDGIPEIIKDNRSGILIRPNSPEDLSDAMVKFLRNETHAGEIGATAKAMLVQDTRFHLNYMAQQTGQLYLQLLERKTKRKI